MTISDCSPGSIVKTVSTLPADWMKDDRRASLSKGLGLNSAIRVHLELSLTKIKPISPNMECAFLQKRQSELALIPISFYRIL